MAHSSYDHVLNGRTRPLTPAPCTLAVWRSPSCAPPSWHSRTRIPRYIVTTTHGAIALPGGTCLKACCPQTRSARKAW